MAKRQNTFLLKRSNVPGKVPSPGDLQLGELALNTADVILYASGTTTNQILPIGWDRLSALSGGTVNGNIISTGYFSGTTYYGSGSNLTGINDYYITGGTYSNGTLTLNRQNGSVTITGFTTINLNLSATSLTVDYIDFNTGTTVSPYPGRINWDAGTGTLNVNVGDSGTGLIDLQVGQEEIVRVYNSEATTLVKGEIVYVSGSQGNRPAVKRASAVSDGYSVTTLGMVDRDISSGSEGYVTTFGIISNLNTLGLTGGTPIWLSPTTPGAYTSTKPIAPQHTVLIGYVVRVSATVGSIFVNISNGWELEEIHDVRISGATEGDLLVRSSYNGSNVWVNSKTLNGSYRINGGLNVTGTTSASTYNITSTPSTNTSETDVLVRNSTTGNIEKRSINSLINTNNTVTVALTGSTGVDFYSIKSAVESIVDASSGNTYTVHVAGGVYNENPFRIPSWVSVVGESSLSTVINAIDSSQTLINLSDQSALFDCQVQGCTGTNVSAIVYSSSTTPQSSAISYVENVRFGSNYTHAKVVASAGANIIMQCSNVKYGGYPFTVGFYATNDGSGIGRMQLRNVTSTNGGIVTTTGLVFAKADAASCGFIVNGCLLTKAVGAAAGTGFYVENGGFLRLTAVNFQRWDTGIYAPQIGSAPSIDAIALNFENNNTDVNIAHSGATGKIQGTDNFLKTKININAPLYEVNQYPRQITVAKKGGDFSSIKSAVDYLASSGNTSSSNRYIINVGPGVFSEGEIDLTNTPYVSIVGSNIQTTQVIPNTSSQHIFKIGVNNEISFLSLSGAGSGYAGIYAYDIGDFGQAHKISIYDCDTGLWIESSTQDTKFYGEYIDINGTFTNGTKVVANSNYISLANLENYYVFQGGTNNSYGNYATGSGATINLTSSSLEGNGMTGSTATLSRDGAFYNISATDVIGWGYGHRVENVGNPSRFEYNGVTYTDNIWDINVEQSSASGVFQGISSHQKITTNSSNVYWNFLDTDDGELDITRKASVTFSDGSHTDFTTLIFEGSSMGLLSGGTLTTVSGTTIQAVGGFGYLEKSDNGGIIRRIDWSNTQLTLSANTDSYIFINENSLLSSSGSKPNTIFNILLGRVVTNSTGVEFIDLTPFNAEHTSNRFGNLFREALGPIYASGSIVTEGTTPLTLNVSSGEYYYSTNRVLPSGGNGITFTQYRRSGTGSTWVTTATTFVNNTQYDNNGTLTGLTTSYYTKHTLYVVGDGSYEKYLLVLGQNQYSTLVEVEDALLPTPPSYFTDSVVQIASIYVKQGTTGITQVEDIRPTISFRAGGVNASSVHGNLLGLSADDHTQYLLGSGTRAMSGNLNMGGNEITNVGNVDGVDVSSHATRHQYGGADPVGTVTPSPNAIPYADVNGSLDSWVSTASTTTLGRVRLSTTPTDPSNPVAVGVNDARFTGSLTGVTYSNNTFVYSTVGGNSLSATINVVTGWTVGGNLIVTGNTSTDLVRITQEGTGNALIVEDAANPDTTPFVVNASGNVGIGTSTFGVTNPEKLLVSPTNQINAIVAKGSINNYMQLNIQNTSNAVNSTSDVVATSNNGSETINYIDMGINGGNYNGGYIGVANDAYLYSTGRELLIGNTSTGTTGNVKFFAGNNATNFGMTLTYDQKLGIGTTTPQQKLHVGGNVLINGALTAITTTGVNWFSGNTSTDLVRITQLGSGNAFVVEDDVNPDSTQFVIGPSGNVSIGTGSTGVYKLDVADFDPQLRFYASTNNRAFRISPSNGSIEADNSFLYLNRVSNTNIILGNGGGNVAVGPVTPIAKLHVNNTGTSNSFLVEDDTNPDSTPFVIDNSGNVGIGTVSPTALVHISGSAASLLTVERSLNGNAHIRYKNSAGSMWAGLAPVSPNTYFGIGSAIDLTLASFVVTSGGNVGIGTINPTYRLDVLGSYGRFYNDIDTTGFTQSTLSGDSSGLTTIQVTAPSVGAIGFGVRGLNDTTYSTYGKIGDSFLYSSIVNNGINVVSAAGFGTDDYIRFYAGQTAASGNTPDMYIQGSGSTRGNVGIGTSTPGARLDVNGKTRTTNFQMTSGATSGYVLTSDASGNALWLPPAVSFDNYVTGGTYSNGILTLNRQNGSVTISGLLSADTFVTGFAYSNNNLTISQNQGQSPLSVNISIMTGLTINGNLNVNTTTGINWISGATSTDLVRITQSGSGNAFVVEDDTNPDSTPFVIDNVGKVGIGVSPNAKFEIKSSAYSNIGGLLLRSSTSNNYPALLYETTNEIGVLELYSGTAFTTRIIANGSSYINGGNVGIGTTTPSEKLDVSGKIKTINFQMTSGATSGYVLTSDASGNALWLPPAVSADTFVTGFTYSNNNLTISQNQGRNPLSVNISVMTGLTVNGNLSINTTSGINWVSGATSTDLVRITQSGSGNALVVNNSDGSSATNILQLQGAGTQRFNFRSDGVLSWGSNVSATNYGILSWDTNKSIVGANGVNSLSLYSNGTERVTITSGGTVGIGTPTPSSRLHVSSDGAIFTLEGTTHVYQQFYPQGISAGRFAYLGFPVAGSNQMRIYNETATGFMYLGTNSTARVTISSGGTVGVGIVNPTASLHVNNTTTNNSFLVEDDTNPDSTPFVIDNSGNVGIGITTPSYKLDVAGQTRMSGTGQNVLTIIGSGSSTSSPIFSIQGSQGELFSVTDSLTGSLFSVNDISGLPILEVFSDNTILAGSYQAPSLNTTKRLSLTAGTNSVYSIPTSAYTGAFIDYTLMGTGARAGTIMTIWSGNTAQYTDVSTNDIGNTEGVTFSVNVASGLATLSSSATTTGWTLKTIIRTI